METRLVDWLRIAALGLIFGSSFLAIRIAIEGFGPLGVAAGRITLGAAILLLLTRARGLALPAIRGARGRKIWGAALGFGFFSMALPFFLLSWAERFVASGFAGMSMAATPLLVLPLAHFLVPGDRLTLPKAVGFTIGFVGVVVLIGGGAFASVGADLEPVARFACLGAAACYAIGSIIVRLAPKTDPIAFAASATLLASALILPAALMIEGLPSAPPPGAWAAVVYLGVFPTALANLLLVAVIRSAGPSFTSLINYQVPLWSVVLGVVFLHETLPGRSYGALFLILSGMAISQGWRAPRAR